MCGTQIPPERLLKFCCLNIASQNHCQWWEILEELLFPWEFNVGILFFLNIWYAVNLSNKAEMGEKPALGTFGTHIQLQHRICMTQQSMTITFYSWMLLRSKGRKCTIQLQRFPVFEAIIDFLLLSAACTTICSKKLLPHPLYPCIALVYAVLLRHLGNNQRN